MLPASEKERGVECIGLRHTKILVMQVRMRSELGTRLWTHQDRMDNEIFSNLNLSNVNGLDIVDVLIASIYILFYLLYIVFLLLVITFFILNKKGEM